MIYNRETDLPRKEGGNIIIIIIIIIGYLAIFVTAM